MLILTGAKGDVTHLAFAPTGKSLAASGGGRGMEMWDLPSGNKWGRYTHNYHPSDGPIEFHPTQPLCFASHGTCFIEIETDTKGARALTLNAGGLTYFQVTALLPDGSGFVCRCDKTWHYDGAVRLLRWRPGKELRAEWEAKYVGPKARSRVLPPVVIRVAPDGKTFLTLDTQQEHAYWTPNSQLVRMSVWSVKRGELLRFAKIPAGTAPVLAIAPDSRTFVTCHSNALAVRDAEDLEAAPRRVRNDTRAHFNAIAFHPSGRYLAATTSDKTVKLFDTTTWEVARAFTWDIGRLRSITFSPDGTLAAVGSDSGKIVVWDVDL